MLLNKYFSGIVNSYEYEEEMMTESSMESEGKVECANSLDPELSVTLAIFIAIVCVVENSTVLFIYTRSKEIAESKIFELAFAVLDIFACLLLLPVVVLFELYCFDSENPPLIMGLIENLVGPIAFNGYYSLLFCVAVDRFCAVFYPLQFKIMRKKYINKMLIGVFT